jgi:hypothetical protein
MPPRAILPWLGFNFTGIVPSWIFLSSRSLKPLSLPNRIIFSVYVTCIFQQLLVLLSWYVLWHCWTYSTLGQLLIWFLVPSFCCIFNPFGYNCQLRNMPYWLLLSIWNHFSHFVSLRPLLPSQRANHPKFERFYQRSSKLSKRNLPRQPWQYQLQDLSLWTLLSRWNRVYS